MSTMNQKSRRFSTEFKAMVVAEYYSSALSMADLGRKYGILGSSTISKWVHKHESHEGVSSLNTRTLSATMSGHTTKSKEELLAYIKELERSLELSQDKSIALEHFIRNAEKELGKPLPKKPFTNRSKS